MAINSGYCDGAGGGPEVDVELACNWEMIRFLSSKAARSVETSPLMTCALAFRFLKGHTIMLWTMAVALDREATWFEGCHCHEHLLRLSARVGKLLRVVAELQKICDRHGLLYLKHRFRGKRFGEHYSVRAF